MQRAKGSETVTPVRTFIITHGTAHISRRETFTLTVIQMMEVAKSLYC